MFLKQKWWFFSRGKLRNIPSFHFGDSKVDVVNQYNYLGIVFNFNGKFNQAQKNLFDQANKAMFSLIAKSRRLCLPIDIQLNLFDSLVLPILTYGCEIWGTDNCSLAEKLHLRFCKIILNCKSSTASCMVLGELGRAPVLNHIKGRIANFWSSIFNKKDCSIIKIMYKLSYKLHCQNVINSMWINSVEKILSDCGFTNIWLCQNPDHSWIRSY